MDPITHELNAKFAEIEKNILEQQQEEYFTSIGVPNHIPTAKEYAIKLYKEAYSRYCTELSHEKNHLTAKSMVQWVAGHVLSYMGADRGKDFWGEVKYEAGILKASDVFSNVEY